MMKFNPTPVQPPSGKEKTALRLMIFIGVVATAFLLYNMFQNSNISYFPLYVLLMVTMVYYCLKYLHEWYHYFSISANKKPIATKNYTVDILTTYCAGEPFDMLEETLIAIQQITYLHTAWCCDEADDAKVKQLCLQLGVKHVTRTIKKNAKAGNINNALQQATGELCVVLDPDHIPAPNFLDEVVAYFNDPAVGFVQIVQAYYNQTESLVAKGAAQQTYQFYGPMMMAMHTYGTVQAIGANCTFRRAALDSIGGHASGLSEDMHTAMQLHAKGWQSVYVPAILSRGLVPATMSSYYKQQLKWSRGTWELLVTSYLKLFTKFTWRQKIHYGTLPFHYLCGLIFFINFLIPVISLFTGYIPLKMDVVSFLLAVFPFFAMGILIRHYVQKWVAEESDRGFHLIGGILQIGTWWIHSVGFVYTILRKKVPYIPTPKNDNDPLPFLLNLPNILVALISLIAIVYGLWYDYTPYTIFMVFLASLQIFFMVFILSISGYTSKMSKINAISLKLRQHSGFIEKAHGFLRSYSIALSVLVIVLFSFGLFKQQQLSTYLPKPLPGLKVFYMGLHQPGNAAIPGSKQIISLAAERKDIAIISFDINWGAGENNKLDVTSLQKVYGLHAIPLLTFYPSQKDNSSNLARDTAAMRHITEGKYDTLLLSFATQIAALNKPIFLQLGTGSIQNQYPLFSFDNTRPEDFISSWQYVHRLFNKAGATSVIWVWTPRDTASVSTYFPGKNYVDWLGVNIAETKTATAFSNSNSFDSIYRPFHQLSFFRAGLPVMITGVAGDVINNNQWWNAAWKTIDTAFTEIKSVIADAPGDRTGHPASTALAKETINNILLKGPSVAMPINIQEAVIPKATLQTNLIYLPINTKNIVYDKGYTWFRNRHTLNLKTLQADVAAMKKIGINTIERTMPGFYDNNLDKVLVANNMNLIPRFSFFVTPEIVGDEMQMQIEKAKIISAIKNNRSKKYIVAWNLGADILFTLGNQSYKPDYFYYQQKYVQWLAAVCREIRLLDTVRPIVMDLQWDMNGLSRFKYYKTYVPQISNYMLQADVKCRQCLSEPLQQGMAWGKVSVELWPLVPAINQQGTIPAWQDIENTDYITLNGLLDLQGRKKEWYNKVANAWGKQPVSKSLIPDIKILRPAKITYENTLLKYQVLYKSSNAQWSIYNDTLKNIRFEWYLVRVDQYDNTMFIKKVGEGASVELSTPMQPQYYKLYVEAIKGDEVKMMNTTLNTPLE